MEFYYQGGRNENSNSFPPSPPRLGLCSLSQGFIITAKHESVIYWAWWILVKKMKGNVTLENGFIFTETINT